MTILLDRPSTRLTDRLEGATTAVAHQPVEEVDMAKKKKDKKKDKKKKSKKK